MDLNDATTREVFFDLYGSLPRAGPGNDASTWRALEMYRRYSSYYGYAFFVAQKY